ncbi:MAG: hypothetical protein HY707_04475 [Ignavibacteriae bacterium]|nr:hypothetical protein [Ignavibacteriota bacterium]
MTSLNGPRQHLCTRSAALCLELRLCTQHDGLRKSDALTLVAWAMPLEATFALKPPQKRWL